MNRYFVKKESDTGMSLDLGSGEIRGPWMKVEDFEQYKRDAENLVMHVMNYLVDSIDFEDMETEKEFQDYWDKVMGTTEQGGGNA